MSTSVMTVVTRASRTESPRAAVKPSWLGMAV